MELSARLDLFWRLRLAAGDYRSANRPGHPHPALARGRALRSIRLALAKFKMVNESKS